MSLPYKKSILVQRTSIVMVILTAFIASTVRLTLCDVLDGVRDSVSEQSSEIEFGNSKPHQYLLGAPRMGRSSASSIWSSLEEGALGAPNQMQAFRSFPGPLRSSLLFLIGNRRMIGPRSGSGLLPQARIGRRAGSPIGLMPQPRVGRSSKSEADPELDGQQEVAIASLSDSSSTDALESLIGI